MILNNVRQHNCFIIPGSYIGYMFRLTGQSSSSGLFSRLSHKVLCTHWDPSACTSIKYIKSDQLPREVCCTYCVTVWLKCLKHLKKNNIWRLPAKNRVPLPSSCCLELWGLFTGDVGVSPLLLLLRWNARVVVYSHMMNMCCRVLDSIVCWGSLSVCFGMLYGMPSFK
jgi:hypothetical protein